MSTWFTLKVAIRRWLSHTQGIENFWSHFKRGVTGVYRVVSKKYLQAYVDEYGFRFNHRNEPIFELLLGQISGVKTLKAL